MSEIEQALYKAYIQLLAKKNPIVVDCSNCPVDVLKELAKSAKNFEVLATLTHGEVLSDMVKAELMKLGGEYIAFRQEVANVTDSNDYLVFQRGDETKVVVESKNFAHSIFREQYIRALAIFEEIYNKSDKDASNIVAFCGDRGEGKTSCMQTVASILSKKEIYDTFKKECLVSCGDYTERVDVLTLIDPAFFDHRHNVIELVLGLMYTKAVDHKAANEGETVSRNQLFELFAETKDNLSHIEHGEKADRIEGYYDSLEDLKSLSQGVRLRERIETLFAAYLKYMGKQKIVICLDDIDLNMKYGYQMAEHVRKYLGNSHCIILISVKVEQLTRLVKNNLTEDAKTVEEELLNQMATKYVTKLLPDSHRVRMTRVVDLAKRRLKIIDGDDSKEYVSLREAVVQMIYAKTRFLFYNSVTEICPIIPNNLRSLRHLIATLYDMPDFESNQKNAHNKQVFKGYFYYDWAAAFLNKEDYQFVCNLINNDDVTSINKKVVQYLYQQFFSYAEGNDWSLRSREYDRPFRYYEDKVNRTLTPLFREICNKTNRAYNVSVGDVLYVLKELESIFEDEDQRNLLFFLRSYYSICLYEFYDVVTEEKNQVYPSLDENASEIYKLDKLYNHTNVLQRFVAGSMFSYKAGDLMPQEARTERYRDLCEINGEKLRQLIGGIVADIYQNKKEGKSDEELSKKTGFIEKFKLMEFFLLTCVQRVDKSAIPAPRTRTNMNAFELFKTSVNSYVFDVMAPFYTLLNPKYTYNRFEICRYVKEKVDGREVNIDSEVDLYDFAIGQEKSLLSLMIKKCQTVRKSDDPIHNLLSCSVIRNVDVQNALVNIIDDLRDVISRDAGSGLKQTYSKFYKGIISTDLKTYQLANDDRYTISFQDLEILNTFLNEVDNDTLLDYFEFELKDKKLTAADRKEQIKKVFNGFEDFSPADGGAALKDFIRRNYKTVYDACEKQHPGFWDEVISDDKKYRNRAAIISNLLKAYDAIISVNN